MLQSGSLVPGALLFQLWSDAQGALNSTAEGVTMATWVIRVVQDFNQLGLEIQPRARNSGPDRLDGKVMSITFFLSDFFIEILTGTYPRTVVALFSPN